MSQHFLLTAKARTLSLAQVMRLTDTEAERAFMAVRWHATDGKPVCPHCGCEIVWDCRKANGAPRWRCKACRKSFSVTSGTLFASAKMPLRNYLAAIAIFVNEVKGKSALALSRDLDVQYKTSFVLAHKIREAMASELKGMQVGGAILYLTAPEPGSRVSFIGDTRWPSQPYPPNTCTMKLPRWRS